MKIKDNINKAKLFRELTEIGKKKFESTCEPYEDLKVFLDGAETVFKLLRLPVVSNISKPKKSKKENKFTPYAEWSKVLSNL